MSRVFGLVLVFLLLGCGSRWTHATKTQDEYHQDVYACEKDTAASRLRGFEGDRFYNACMRAKGWRD